MSYRIQERIKETGHLRLIHDYKNTPCVLIQFDSTHPLILKRQIVKRLRLCAFRLGCVANIHEHKHQKFVFEMAKRIFSESSQPWVVQFNSKGEWFKQQANIRSKITKTFLSIERGKYSFPTYKYENMKIFQSIHVIDLTKDIYDESSKEIRSKGRATQKTIYLLCAFHTLPFSKVPKLLKSFTEVFNRVNSNEKTRNKNLRPVNYVEYYENLQKHRKILEINGEDVPAAHAIAEFGLISSGIVRKKPSKSKKSPDLPFRE
jgi:hypothetical protein